MVQDWEKYVNKLPPREREVALYIIEKIKNNDLETLDVVKMKNTANTYRVKH